MILLLFLSVVAALVAVLLATLQRLDTTVAERDQLRAEVKKQDEHIRTLEAATVRPDAWTGPAVAWTNGPDAAGTAGVLDLNEYRARRA